MNVFKECSIASCLKLAPDLRFIFLHFTKIDFAFSPEFQATTALSLLQINFPIINIRSEKLIAVVLPNFSCEYLKERFNKSPIQCF